MALLTLVFGLLYLSQYQKNLIEAKLETFQATAEFVSAAIAENTFQESLKSEFLEEKAVAMVRRLSEAMNQDIRLFNQDGLLIIDSQRIVHSDNKKLKRLKSEEDTLYTIQILKNMARYILKFLPDRRELPDYPKIEDGHAWDYPDAGEAMKGHTSLSAWSNGRGHMFLSAATPLHNNSEVVGAVLLTREARDIESDIGRVWIDVLKIFGGTLIVTILLSIYLSGLIARPLRKLMRAAEAVRTGKSGNVEIPDLSHRHDEIGELSLVLRAMTQALWDRMDAIESFAADVSHELKNPLTSLRSAVETAAIVKDKKDQEKLMKIVLHDIERLDRLISDISSASRLDAELSREVFEKVNLREGLQDLMEIYKAPLERRKKDDQLHGKSWNDTAVKDGVEIRLQSAAHNDIFVWGLEGRLHQVFQNLLANALSFSPKGGHVDINVFEQGERVFITISDEGPGIPEGKLEDVFERFYSQRPEHEDYGKHSGLGLSICRQIVIALGGDIFAENIKDLSGNTSGARFTVLLSAA